MKHKFEEGVEDVLGALTTGRPVRHHGPYGILVGNGQWHFSPAVVHEPTPTGAQILTAAGIAQPVEHLLFKMLRNGLLEEIRPEQVTDLRTAGAERFLVFHSDRSFRFQLDDRTFEWGATHISGATLKHLAGVEISHNDVWQNVHGEAERLIGDSDLADLSTPGVERFCTKPIKITILVNVRPREIHQRRVSYWEIVKMAYPEAGPNENIIYSVEYSRGPHSNPEGSMVDGQHVHVKDGMTFYVTPTDKS